MFPESHSQTEPVDTPNIKAYQTVEQAIHYFVSHQREQPSLADVAASVNLSEYHLQRLFSEWAGISPKQFLQYLTKESAKKLLTHNSVLAASHESGLSGSGRLHDLMISYEGVTPGQYKRQGEGLRIVYGQGTCVFGHFILGHTDRGICKLAFFNQNVEFSEYEQELKKEWSNASFLRDDQSAQSLAKSIFPDPGGARMQSTPSLRVLLKGSPFQVKVWEALLSIPEGEVRSYQDVAELIDAPSSVRAVASAIARNHIGYLIPCHRVIRSTGEFSQYRWGRDRKSIMIACERCVANKQTSEQIMN